ncbi:hypothetical protein MK280_03130, partial [Myxococcota bacterium]|nr:hypothetical protein [Myxococcota bacterium]
MKIRETLDLLIPERCLGCSRPDGAKLCDGCQMKAPWSRPAYGHDRGTVGRFPCITLLRFEGVAVDWIHRFKYPRRGLQGLDGPAWALGSYLAKQLGEQLGPLNPQPGDEVMPIPLHPRRLRTRGFNPAGLIARFAFAKYPVPVRYRDLVRIRETAPQAGLGSRARLQNMRGAFAFRPRRHRRLPARVWLGDDVRTTGATLFEAANALWGGGVQNV